MKKTLKQKKSRKIKVGIVGCGNIFPRHFEAITTNQDRFELVAVCDFDPRRLELRSKEHQVPGFSDHKEMYKKMSGKMNLVVIATPNSFHYEQSIQALKSGYDILIEKPIDFTAKRIQEIKSIAKKSKRKAYSVLQVRYNPTVMVLKEALSAKLLGDIRSVSLIQRWQRPYSYFESWRSDINVGGRTLYEVGIHYLDIFYTLVGQPKILSSASFSNKHKHVAFEDTVLAIGQLENGASCSFEVTIAVEPHNLECSIAIMGSEGYIKLGGRALDLVETANFTNQIYKEKWEDLSSSLNKSLEPNSYGAYQGSCPNHPHLYREIAAGKGLDITESVPVVQIIEDIYSKEIK